jgi:hypothetical protein
MKIGDLVKFREDEEWKVGIVFKTWRTYKRRIQSVDILTPERIVPRQYRAVEIINEGR